MKKTKIFKAKFQAEILKENELANVMGGLESSYSQSDGGVFGSISYGGGGGGYNLNSTDMACITFGASVLIIGFTGGVVAPGLAATAIASGTACAVGLSLRGDGLTPVVTTDITYYMP